MDQEIATWKSFTFAESTKAAYKCHRDIYFSFCKKIQCSPVPITSLNLCRYIAFLSRTRAFTTVQQYTNIVRILHLELGYGNPLQDNFSVKCLMTGLKRAKGNSTKYKMPINPNDLFKIRALLDLNSVEDSQFWAVVVTCFYGLLRISSVTVTAASKWQSSHSVRRQDIQILTNGCVLTVSSSKTIQFKDRTFHVPLPYNRGHLLCPTSAVLKFLSLAGEIPNHMPLFSVRTQAGIRHLTQHHVRRKLSACLGAIGLPAGA